MKAAEQKHTPFGRPKMLQVNQKYCVLHQEGFISGFSQQARMPLWTSFTVDPPVGGPVHQGELEPFGSSSKATGSLFQDQNENSE